jgi:hypothetical protein
MRPNAGQVDERVGLAKHMIAGEVPFEAEAVEQRLSHHPPLAIVGRLSAREETGIRVESRNRGSFRSRLWT